MRKALMIGAALTALAGAPLFATAAGAADVPAEAQQVDAQSLIGREVVNAEGERIGEVDNVVVDAEGQIRHVIVGVGGFLGIGEKNVALRWDELVLTADGESIAVPYTRDQLTALPDHVYPEAVERGTVYGYEEDLRANAYLQAERQSTAAAAEETGESVAETAAETANEAASEEGVTTLQAARLEASALLGESVETAGGEAIGEIDEIWLDADGQVAGVVVDVGGFLGVGSDPVLLAWSDLQIRQEGEELVVATALTREQIEGLTRIEGGTAE